MVEYSTNFQGNKGAENPKGEKIKQSLQKNEGDKLVKLEKA